MPFTATIAAVAEGRRRRGHGVSPAPAAPSRRIEQPSRGPQPGQAMGWAWKRRSAGSSYSARQSVAHREARHRGERAVVGDAERRS